MMYHHRRYLSCAALAAIVLLELHAMPAVALCLAGGDDGASTGGMLTATNHHMHLFMHESYTGPSATAVLVVNGTGTPVMEGVRFGDTVVMDDLLTEGPSRASRHVGRAQGTYVTASLPRDREGGGGGSPAMLLVMNLVLTDDDYAGSTVAVMGRNDVSEAVRELAVVGGTGRFRMATGYVLWKTSSWHGKSAVLELDVYLRTT